MPAEQEWVQGVENLARIWKTQHLSHLQTLHLKVEELCFKYWGSLNLNLKLPRRNIFFTTETGSKLTWNEAFRRRGKVEQLLQIDQNSHEDVVNCPRKKHSWESVFFISWHSWSPGENHSCWRGCCWPGSPLLLWNGHVQWDWGYRKGCVSKIVNLFSGANLFSCCHTVYIKLRFF